MSDADGKRLAILLNSARVSSIDMNRSHVRAFHLPQVGRGELILVMPIPIFAREDRGLALASKSEGVKSQQMTGRASASARPSELARDRTLIRAQPRS